MSGGMSGGRKSGGMSGPHETRFWPVEIRLLKAEKALEVAFDDGQTFRYPAELLRVESPSAEVQGHGPSQKQVVAGQHRQVLAFDALQDTVAVRRNSNVSFPNYRNDPSWRVIRGHLQHEVGKRFGGAVSRNRVKRLFRELTRQLRGQLISGHSLVVFPKRNSIAQPFAGLKEAWVSTLQRQRLLRMYES